MTVCCLAQKNLGLEGEKRRAGRSFGGSLDVGIGNGGTAIGAVCDPVEPVAAAGAPGLGLGRRRGLRGHC